MYARVRPTANHRDLAYHQRDVPRLRRAERRGRVGALAARAGSAAWWIALCATLFVLTACAGYLTPYALSALP